MQYDEVLLHTNELDVARQYLNLSTTNNEASDVSELDKGQSKNKKYLKRKGKIIFFIECSFSTHLLKNALWISDLVSFKLPASASFSGSLMKDLA